MIINPPQTEVQDSFSSPSPVSRPPAAPSNAPAVRSSAIVRNSSCIGPALKVKGEVSGNEELQVDGKVEGSITLPGQKLIVGRSGQLSCNVDAREVVIYGKVIGNVRASDLIEIKKDASVIGDIRAARITMEDGAHFKGYVDMEQTNAPATAGPGTRTHFVPSDGPAN